MRLSDLLAPQVSRSCRARGHDYFESGAVRDVARTDDGALVATVEGTEDYEVAVAHAGNTVRVSCTCPFFYDRREICKHIWATVLAAESRGLEVIAPGTVPALVAVEPIAPEPAVRAENFFRSFAAGSRGAPAVRATAPRPRPQPPAPPPPGASCWTPSPRRRRSRRQVADSSSRPGSCSTSSTRQRRPPPARW